ncbi:MAG: hypothetical protein ACPLSN_03660 [Dictyoglomus turgidum]
MCPGVQKTQEVRFKISTIKNKKLQLYFTDNDSQFHGYIELPVELLKEAWDVLQNRDL